MNKVLDHIYKLRLPNFKNDQTLVSEFRKITLLTPSTANTKMNKNTSVLSYILHLSPSDLSGYNVCPSASAGCKKACLNTSGRGRFESVSNARLRKTLYFIKFREQFIDHLKEEISKIDKKGYELGLLPVIRLNGTSDILWENYDIFQSFPHIQFYDYTKIFNRLKNLKLNPIKNYDLTFSATESNWNNCVNALKLDYNVAVVFSRDIPLSYQGYEVISGENNDLRYTDKKGCIVGLKAKGMAKKDLSGFVKTITEEKISA